MKTPRSLNSNSVGNVGFNMTPLIDMVFLLIIFFLVATFYVQRGVNQPVELPSALTAESENNNDDQKLILTVSKEGQYWIGGNQLELETVADQLADFASRNRSRLNASSVIIRADVHADFKQIKPIIRLCAEERIPYFSFATEKK